MKKNIITTVFIACIALAFYATATYGKTKAECEADCDKQANKFARDCKGEKVPSFCESQKMETCKNMCIDAPVRLPE